MIESFVQDMYRAVRGIRREPALAATAAVILAICIGANTTVFSLVNSILLRRLPFPDSQRICWIAERMGRDQMDIGLGADYYSLRDENRVFEDIAAYDTITMNWAGIERPEQLDAAQVTPSFFRVMGTSPAVGRYLAAGEEGRKAPPVVVLSYAFWRNRLGADPRIVGRTVVLDRLPATVVGVMPQGFDYPKGTQVWKPLDMNEAEQRPRSVMRPMRLVYMVARLKRRVSDLQLRSELARLTRSIRAEYPRQFETAGFLNGMAIISVPLQRRITGDLRPALLVLSGAVGLVLLIACANLANLLLARAAIRQWEMAVRMALGSGRARILRQALAESVALAVPGGIAGCAMAWLAVAGLNAWKPPVLVPYPAISMDNRTLLFTLGLTLATALVFGIAPSLAAARTSIQGALRSAGHAHSGGRSATRLRRMLVVGECSVSLVLLIAAGLLARSFVKLSKVELGFPARNLLTLRVNLAQSQYATAEAQVRFYDDVLERVRRLPMVAKATVSTDVPLSGEGPFQGMTYQVAGRPAVPIAQRPQTNMTVVDTEFFRTLGVPLRRGRTFDSSDSRVSKPAIVVNEAFVRQAFRGEDPVGRGIVYGPNDGSSWTIVGVVGNVRGSNLGTAPDPLVYRCTCQAHDPWLSRMRFVARTTEDPAKAVHAIEAQIYAEDRNQPVFDVKTMDERLDAALAPQRFQLLLVGTFAAVAVILAALGVFGVMAYLVTRRTREIGIRVAMGARPGQVQLLVIRESAILAAAAILAGWGCAWALTRYLNSMLYGVTALDGATFAVMPAVLGAVALGAALVPARRASQIDAMSALRQE